MQSARRSSVADPQRFWAKVGRPVAGSGCWPWSAYRDEQGYGRIMWRRKSRLAHRVAFEINHGREPAGVVRHLCNNPACVNPGHLREGSVQDNSDDMVRAGRQARGEALSTSSLSVADVEAIRVEYASGRATREDLGQRFGVSETCVRQIVRGETWKHVGGPVGDYSHRRQPHGSRHHKARVDEAQVREIRRRYALGDGTCRSLGDDFGVSASLISQIVRRKIWKHVA